MDRILRSTLVFVCLGTTCSFKVQQPIFPHDGNPTVVEPTVVETGPTLCQDLCKDEGCFCAVYGCGQEDAEENDGAYQLPWDQTGLRGTANTGCCVVQKVNYTGTCHTQWSDNVTRDASMNTWKDKAAGFMRLYTELATHKYRSNPDHKYAITLAKRALPEFDDFFTHCTDNEDPIRAAQDYHAKSTRGQLGAHSAEADAAYCYVAGHCNNKVVSGFVTNAAAYPMCEDMYGNLQSTDIHTVANQALENPMGGGPFHKHQELACLLGTWHCDVVYCQQTYCLDDAYKQMYAWTAAYHGEPYHDHMHGDHPIQ